MQWNDTLSVGDAQIDRQHKHLFNLLQALDSRLVGRSSRDVAKVAVGELKRYVEKHLRDEEWVLKSVKYPDYETHCAQHREFEDRLEQLAGQLDSRPEDAHDDTLRAIQEFVLGWLFEHVKSVDMRYKPYLKQAQQPKTA